MFLKMNADQICSVLNEHKPPLFHVTAGNILVFVVSVCQQRMPPPQSSAVMRSLSLSGWPSTNNPSEKSFQRAVGGAKCLCECNRMERNVYKQVFVFEDGLSEK